MNKSTLETIDSRWNWLYKLGGAAALITAVFIPLQVILFIAWPPPSTVSGYFTLFQNNKLLGLLDLDLLLVIDQALAVLILLTLYIVLRRTSESFMSVALALGLVVAATYFASNTAFNMLSLSDQYAAATTDAQRAMFLAAGQAMLAIYTGTAFQVYYFLGAIVGIIVSAVMLQSRSRVFSKGTAYMGILANAISLGLYVPTIGIYISIFSVLFLEIWNILVARRLLQLARLEGQLLLQPA